MATVGQEGLRVKVIDPEMGVRPGPDSEVVGECGKKGAGGIPC